MKIVEILSLKSLKNKYNPEFEEEWYSLTQENPLNPKERIFNDAVKVEMQRDPNGGYYITLISTKKEQGNASNALKTLTTLADKHNVRLSLVASAFDGSNNKTAHRLVQTIWFYLI